MYEVSEITVYEIKTQSIYAILCFKYITYYFYYNPYFLYLERPTHIHTLLNGATALICLSEETPR